MDDDIAAIPPEDLRWRVAGHRDANGYLNTGRLSVTNIARMLAILGKSFADYPRALDFGCGCGRILQHMERIANESKLYGVDIDSESIGWVQQNIPYVEASVNDGLPPLKFAEGFFDLVFNHSVFTHLDEKYQDAWLSELARVTRPGGVLVLSIAGEEPFLRHVDGLRKAGEDPSSVLNEFNTKGIVYVTSDGWDGGPFPDFYHTAFHAPWYVFEHWGRFFEIRAHVPRGALNFSDYVLLERRKSASSRNLQTWLNEPPPPETDFVPTPREVLSRQ